MSQRFYCPEPPIDGLFRLDVDEARHLTRVCRKGAGDVVTIFDGRGFSTLARIVATGKDSTSLAPEGEPLPEREPECLVEIATAAPKGDRFDWLIEKAVEIGVSRIVPIATERSVVDPRGSKLDRLRRAIIEASKQCGRTRLMELGPTEKLRDYLSRGGGVRLLADPAGEPPRGWPAIPAGATVRLVIGPEGGLTDEEVELARAEGWTPARFAAAILRIETGVVAGASAILARVQPTH